MTAPLGEGCKRLATEAVRKAAEYNGPWRNGIFKDHPPDRIARMEAHRISFEDRAQARPGDIKMKTTISALGLGLLLAACGGSDSDAPAASEPAPAPEPTVAAAPAFDAEGAFNIVCATCHGTSGVGDGPAGLALDPPPASFAEEAFWEGQTDESLFNVIKNGGASVGKSPLMAAWGASYNDDQINGLVEYVKSFRPE